MTPDGAGATVAIVEDHGIATEGIAARLRAAGFVVTAEVAAVERLDECSPLPEVVICDLHLPGCSGAAAVGRLVGRGCAVLATSGVARSEEILACLAAGARGFLPKTAPPRSFVDATAGLAAGSYHVSPELGHLLLEDARLRPLPRADLGPRARAALHRFERGDTGAEVASLLGVPGEVLTGILAQVWDATARRRRRHAPSPREWELLTLVSAGLTHKELATRLALSPTTVPTLLERLRGKYLALHPEADPTLPPLGAARLWAAELGLQATAVSRRPP